MDYIDEIINNIETQYYHMEMLYHIKPNKVILGERILYVLNRDARLQWFNPERDITTIGTICGLPFTVDYDNVNTIEVCFELNKEQRDFVRNRF